MYSRGTDRHRLGALAIGLTLAAAVLAGDQPTPLQRLRALQKEITAAEDAWRAAWAKSKLPNPQDDPHVAKLYQMLRKKNEASFDEAVAIARADPKSDTGFACLEWLLGAYHAHYLPAARPIATTWNVSAWPTVYVIDAKGVIRYRTHQSTLAGDRLEKLVTEAEG